MRRALKSMTLRQEIVLALSAKAIVLFAIWAAFFSDAREPPPDAQQAAAQILPPPSTKETDHDANHRTR